MSIDINSMETRPPSPKEINKKSARMWETFGVWPNYDVGTSCPDSSWSVCFQVLFCLQQLQFPREDKRLVKCSWRNLASTNKHRTEGIFCSHPTWQNKPKGHKSSESNHSYPASSNTDNSENCDFFMFSFKNGFCNVWTQSSRKNVCGLKMR